MVLDDTFKQLDLMIREGDGTRARRLFQEIYKKKIPHEKILEAARFSRRLDVPYVGLRLLEVAMRSEPIPVEFSVSYSECLLKAGAPREAWRLLMDLPEKKLPPAADFAKASALIEQWDYEGALPWLRKYVEARGLSEYERLIGQVNLAAVLAYERKFKEASYLIHQLLQITGERKLNVLRANLFEIAAYHSICHRKYDRAASLLAEASTFLGATGSNDQFFVRKWGAILRMLRDREKDQLLDIRTAAKERGLWEVIRDCDRYQALAEKNVDLARYVYFGTRYPGFRQHLIDDFDETLPLEEHYLWRLGGSSGKAYELNLSEGTAQNGEKIFPTGGLAHRLFGLLASDFFHPFRIPALFDDLFPGERFNPDSGPLRVRQALKLLRGSLSKARVPLAVELTTAGYRLVAKGPCVVRLASSERGAGKKALLLKRLEARWPRKPFTAADVATLLDLSLRSAQRLIAEGISENRMKVSAEGPTKTYEFLSSGEN